MKNKNLNTLVKISLLGAVSFVIMMLKLPLPLFPNFLTIDFSDVPALIGAFALGPVEGVIIQLLKNILNGAITGSQTAWVGELANFLVGSAYVFTAGIIYKRHKSRKTAVVGMLFGILAMTLVATVFNYFVLIPLYAKLFGGMDKIVAAGAAVNPLIKDYNTFILWAIAPFNMVKGIIIAGITIPLYKGLSPILHKEADFARKKEKYNQI